MGMAAWWRGLGDGVVRLGARIPMPCPLCGGAARGGCLCPGCRAEQLAEAPGGRCRWCAVRLPGPDAGCLGCTLRAPAYDYAIAAIDYAAPGQSLVWRAKRAWHGPATLALADLLADAVARDVRGLPAGCVLAAIPASAAALRRRGYNPAGRIGRRVARHLGLPWAPGLLRAGEDDGLRQHRLDRRQRLERGGARFAAPALPPGLAIALVDDVMTTGSTLEAAARVLKAAGAGTVIALPAARTPAPGDGPYGRPASASRAHGGPAPERPSPRGSPLGRPASGRPVRKPS